MAQAGVFMRYPIKYGTGSINVHLPDTLPADVFTLRLVPPLANPTAAFTEALDMPEGCRML
jgi:hypothetical protein